MTDRDYDLFNNPMVEAARKGMTPEQIEEYKKIGEYMYTEVDYKIREVGSQVKPPTETNLVDYAVDGLKAGLDPMDLSQEEVGALVNKYGDKWYEQFDFEEDEVPKPFTQLVSEEDAKKEIDRQSKTLNLTRQQRRLRERQLQKQIRKNKKNSSS